MSARSNFLTIELADDGATLLVHGESDGSPLDVLASVVARPAWDEPVPPRTELTGRFVGNVVVSPWQVPIANDGEAPFDGGDRVLVAGVALREDGDHDVWLDSLTIAPAR